MRPDDPAATTAAEPLDRRRNRTTRRIALIGSFGVGTAAAATVGILGGSGRAAMAVLLLVASASTATSALHAVGALVLDEFRGHDPAGGRAGLAIGLFVLAAFLMAMLAGVGG